MYFEKYNVEVRDRVKCLSAIEGKGCESLILVLLNQTLPKITLQIKIIKFFEN